MVNPSELPLLSALQQAAQREHSAFYAPGHKRGQGSPPALVALLGSQALRADLPELPDLDNLFAPEGPILQAQQLAAATFAAEETFFLANGSTCGIEAAVMAVCAPGDKILVPRNVHRSVLAALVLSGAHPVYLSPVYSPDWDLAYGITPQQVEAAIARHPDLQAVILVSPSYHGVCADVAAIAAHVHAHSAILIVDEAHGSHLGFHDQLPGGAIAGGADLVIQSTHKVLSALTQAAMLHVQGPRVDRDRLRQALQLTQSTSPNYWLLASLDAARHQMAQTGQALMERTLTLARQVRSRLAGLEPLRCLTPADVAAVPGPFQLDLTRLTVDVSTLGLTGFAADERLHTDLGVTAELPTLRQLTFILSLGNTPEEGEHLVAALTTLRQDASPLTKPIPTIAVPLPEETVDLSIPPLSPRAAFFAPSRTVSLSQAIGHIATEALCPYPPGIPILLPGETITPEAIAQLQRIQAAGGILTGNSDPTLRSLRIVATV